MFGKLAIFCIPVIGFKVLSLIDQYEKNFHVFFMLRAKSHNYSIQTGLS